MDISAVAIAVIVPCAVAVGALAAPRAPHGRLRAVRLALLAGRVPVPARVPRRVLAIGAHPDDLELGCGGTMAKLADAGHEVHALVLTAGARGGDAAARPAEAVRGGRFLGAADVVVLGLADTRLAEREADLVAAIEEVVARVNPDLILTHSANDHHQDHLAVHRATLRAARRHEAILCYESPSALGFEPRVFVDIGGYVDVKTTAVGVHRDQRAKPYVDAERVRGLAVHRGHQARTRHAEGYEPVRLLGSRVGDL